MRDDEGSHHALYMTTKQTYRLDEKLIPDEQQKQQQQQLDPSSDMISCGTKQQRQSCPIFVMGFAIGGSMTCFITADDKNGFAIAIWMAILWIIIGSLVLSAVVKFIIVPPTSSTPREEMEAVCEGSTCWPEEDEDDADSWDKEDDDDDEILA